MLPVIRVEMGTSRLEVRGVALWILVDVDGVFPRGGPSALIV